jgi:hypothetical protein
MRANPDSLPDRLPRGLRPAHLDTQDRVMGAFLFILPAVPGTAGLQIARGTLQDLTPLCGSSPPKLQQTMRASTP